FRVVERQQIAKVMKEQMLAQSGVMSDEVQIKVAQLVGARWIVLGTVGTKGRSSVISLRALDSTSAQVAFAETLKVGSDEQIEAGAKQLARRLGDKLLGPAPASASQAAASSEVLGDFDAAQVKDGAQAAARSLALRFPKLTGRILNALASELRAALDGMPQFQLANDPQLTATGRVSGPRGRRSIDLQVIDKSGNVVQKVSVPASF